MSKLNSLPRVRAAAIIQRGNSILMVRHEKGDSSYWLLPGGGVDLGETLHEAVIRELKEEVSLEIRPGAMVFVSESIAPDDSRHMIQCCFLAEIVSGEVALGIDERVVEAAFVSVEELGDLEVHPPLNNELIDGIRNGFDTDAGYIKNRWVDRK
ncbi:MAG: NUDIX hydrolase [Candidatus Hydrogenedentota bacterium]